jgi:hypothetical protein
MSRKHGRKHDHHKPTDDKPATVPNPASENTDAQHCEASHEKCQKKEEPTKWWRNPEWVKAAAESVLAFFAFASFICVFIQLQESHEAMVVDQRAWVSVDVGEKAGKFAVTMKNTGKTPALNVIYFAAFEGGPRGVIPDIPNPKTQKIYHFLVAPGDSRAADDWEVNYLQAFNLGGDRNYVQGDITYDDIFGQTHHTVYCYWTAPPQVRQPGVFPPSTFVICGDHNKMD